MKLLLLSGGASRRMGRDKSRLPVRDSDLLTFQINRFTSAGFDVVSKLPDIHTGYLGPLAGIHSACVTHPEVRHWMVVPVDMPSVSESVLQQLIDEGLAADCATCFDDCPLPLFIPNSNELIELLDSWLTDVNGKRSVYALVNSVGGQWLPQPDVFHELLNINTPDQWRRYAEGAGFL